MTANATAAEDRLAKLRIKTIIFFTREGGDAYLKELPTAEMHRLDSGHFAVEDCLDYISRNIRRFYDEKVAALR
jgi:hypothetical protein